jgi:predicted acylesterase/phospholipase RssA
VCILNHNAAKPYIPESCHPRRPFFGFEPRSSGDYRWLQSFIHEPKNWYTRRILPCARVLPGVQSHRQSHGSRSHPQRPYREHCALPHAQPRSSSYPPTWVRRRSSVGSDQPERGVGALGCIRGGFRAFASSISSVLLNRKMKYLVLGPAGMGIFALIGTLKAREKELVDVKEISGSSAGAILALFLGVGMSVDEILETSLSMNIPTFVKIRIGSFFNKFGFVDMAPIRKKFVDICGSDPTFAEIDMKIYIAAFCMNTSETVYFSKDTHPDMKVIDAVCMSMAVPFIFACGKYNHETYVDGGMKEEYPLTPFFDKKPHEITCIKIKMNRVYQEDIQTPKAFVQTLVRSALSNRVQYDTPIELMEINIEDTDVFDFNMSYEEKLQLFNRGYTFLSA